MALNGILRNKSELMRITPEASYWNRRSFLRSFGMGMGGLMFSGCTSEAGSAPSGRPSGFVLPKRGSDRLYPAKVDSRFKALEDRAMTPAEITGRYNNFYEFTTTKERVDELSAALTLDPWKVQVGGLVEKSFEIDFETLVGKFPMVERVYRMRCVEAWSMVVPWSGFLLRELIDFCKPLGSARYVRFLSFLRPEEAPGQKQNSYEWPYYEGLRLDEARNELAMVVTGIYGKPLPKQHGAPLRVVLPWKYGYKSAKSIVKLEFTEQQPPTFWNDLLPSEYSFLSNVDPKISHPRWSQATELDIGSGDRIETLPWNGYGEWVAGMYPAAS